MHIATTTKPGDKYRSIQRPRQYRALRRRGFSKSEAARISNAQAPGHRVKGAEETLKAPNYGAKRGQVIAGSLVRGNDGKFTSGGKPAAPKPAGKPKPVKPRAAKPPKATPEQRAESRAAEQAKNRDKVYRQLNLPEDAADSLTRLGAGEAVEDDGGLVKMGLAEQDTNGQYRLSTAGRAMLNAAERGDLGAARDAMSRAQDRKVATDARTTARAKREEARAARTAERERKRAEAEAAKLQKKPGGGGGGKEKPTKPARVVGGSLGTAAENAAIIAALRKNKELMEALKQDASDRAMFAKMGGGGGGGGGGGKGGSGGGKSKLWPKGPDGKRRPPGGDSKGGGDKGATAKPKAPTSKPVARELHKRPNDPAQSGHRVKLTSAEANALRGFPSSGSQRPGSDEIFRNGRAASYVRVGNPLNRDSSGVVLRGADGKWYAQRGGETFEVTAVVPSLRSPSWETAGTKKEAAATFAVFKDARGADRWLAVSSTAYRDRDGEIVSSKALAAAVAAGDQSQQRGPLRFWHVPGLDIGDCDYQATAQGGRFLIESGTFRKPEYAQALKQRGAGYQMSIGFVHPATQPDAAGVFSDIAIFERSVVPPGRASNPFTRITTKESRMLEPNKLAALKALLSPDEVADLLAQVETTDKSAQEQGVAFKSDDAPTVYTGPDGTPGIIQDGRFVALKAAPPFVAEAAAEEPAVEDEAKADEAVTEDVTTEVEAEGGSYLTPEELSEITAALAPALAAAVVDALMPALNMETKIGKLVDEVKSSFAGTIARKDASDAEKADQIAALEQQQAQIVAALKELQGDQPAAQGYRPSADPGNVIPTPLIEQALKSAAPVDNIAAWLTGQTA